VYIYTDGGGKKIPCMFILLVVERDTPCKPILLLVEVVKGIPVAGLGGEGIHPARPSCRWRKVIHPP
jgi:hypothetical protein